MNSETVKAAQRLLAEREALGLKKYGTTVDRTDLQPADWLQHAIEEASDLLLYLIRLRQTVQPSPSYAPAAAPEDAAREIGPIESDPADAERNMRAKEEDAERAAYLARWKDAPEGANWLAQNSTGSCRWFVYEPKLESKWVAEGPVCVGSKDLLGSVRCEPRPAALRGEA